MEQINRPNSKGGMTRTYALAQYCDCGERMRVSLRGSYLELWYVCDVCDKEQRGDVWNEIDAQFIELPRPKRKQAGS